MAIIDISTFQLSKVTVSMSSSRSRSRTSSQSGSHGDSSKKKGEKSERLNPGLPQLNKARKMDFKKMKKQRKRRGMLRRTTIDVKHLDNFLLFRHLTQLIL